MGSKYLTKRTQPSCREVGTALVVALLITLILAVVVSASLSRCLYTWNEMGRAYHHASALYAAESGVEKALYAMNHWDLIHDPDSTGFQMEMEDLTGLESVTQLTGDLFDPSGRTIGCYDVVLEVDPLKDRRTIITSQGTAPPEDAFSQNRASRMVRVVIEKPPLFPEFERRLHDDAVISETTILTNGDTEIFGNTRSGDLLLDMDGLDPYSRVTENEYEYYNEETESVETAYGEVYENQNMDEDQENDVYLPFDEYTLEQYKEVAKWQGYYFDYEPEPEELPTTFFREDGITPNVVFITSSIHLSGGYTIGGLIFIVGDVVTDPIEAEFGGNNTIEGLVYTTGHFWGHGGGKSPLNINGAVFGRSVDIRGTSTISYEWEYYHALMDPPQPPPKYRFVTWQELVGLQGPLGPSEPTGWEQG